MRAIAKTLETLARTANEAAVELLIGALDSPELAIQEGALRALLSRRSSRADQVVLQRWSQLSDYYRSLVAERAGWMTGAVREALAGFDPHRFRCACAVAIATRDYDLMPALISAAQERPAGLADAAAAAVLELAELLHEELAGPRDYRQRRDPQLQRTHVLASLEGALGAYGQHHRRALLEAFLLLANRDNAVLKRSLQSLTESIAAPLVEVFTTSSRCGVVRLLLNYLDDPHAPPGALQVIARRQDIFFLRQLFRRFGSEPSAAARANVKRIESIAWVRENLASLDSLGDAEQAGAVQFAICSNIPRQQAYVVLACVLRNGRAAGRRVAALALNEFKGPEADELAMSMLQDGDAQVRANIVLQLRQRNLPGTLNHLLKLVNSPFQAEREAAQAGLEEFQFARYLAAFDGLREDVRKSTGLLVKKIDRRTLPELKVELDSGVRSRRNRALEIAITLQLVDVLLPSIVELLKNQDHYVRLDAIRALASSEDVRAKMALREALLDSSPLVQEAAERALQRAQTAPADTVAWTALRETIGSLNATPKSGDSARSAASPTYDSSGVKIP